MVAPQWMTESRCLRYHVRRPARPGVQDQWPAWLPEPVVTCLENVGITAPWSHQVCAAEAAHAGIHTCLSTGTASGKTLAYLMPILAATYGGGSTSAPPPPELGVRRAAARQLLARPHTALYLAPTKALAHDQLRWCRSLDLPQWRVTTLDGDSDSAERDWARDHAAYVLTNPDLLHHTVLPNHQRWSALLQNLRYVVLDEAHRYRGLFGAHVAQVVRRLRRICRSYGSDPVFILSSATMSDAAHFAGTLIAEAPEDVRVIDDDAAPRPARDVILWQSEQSHDFASAELLARLVAEERQVLTFVGSRTMSEVVAQRARSQLSGERRIESYRAGYLPNERRQVERGLQSRSIAGVASTDALELGVDVSGMDAVVISGFPGTRAALWQQAGRAGRGERDALVVLVARANPLDAWLVDHPESLLSGELERTVLSPETPGVLTAHLTAAAAELPATEADSRWFGPATVPLLNRLAERGTLRRRPTGWYWTRPERITAQINLRSVGAGSVDIIEAETGRVLGQVDPARADREVHPGAIYLHLGERWLVESLDHQDRCAIVRRTRANYYTQPQSITEISLRRTLRSTAAGAGQWAFGEVTLATRVVGYLRRDELTQQVWDHTPLELPEHRLATQATWLTLPEDRYADLKLTSAHLAGGAHAIEHAALALLPAFTPCDRWDVSGLTSAFHPDTGAWTVFFYDGVPGGAGFAAAAYANQQWLRATWQRLVECDCDHGCPACVVAANCPRGNQPLDKQAASVLLALLLDHPVERAGVRLGLDVGG